MSFLITVSLTRGSFRIVGYSAHIIIITKKRSPPYQRFPRKQFLFTMNMGEVWCKKVGKKQ